MPLSSAEISLYSRQMLVPGFGAASQRILRELNILLIGAGGLGCPVALYLVRAGVGGLTIVDGDLVEVSNLHRQVLHDASRVGSSKAHSLVESLRGSGGSGTVLVAEPRWFTVDSAPELLPGHQLVVDATDNASTRYLLNDACVLVPRELGLPSPMPLISGAALGLDGQLSIHHWSGEEGRRGCYRCLFPTPPPSSAAPPCAEVGVLGPVTGMVGCLMALEVLKCAAAWARGEGPPIPSWSRAYPITSTPPSSSSSSSSTAASAAATSASGENVTPPQLLHTPTLPPPTSKLICVDASEPRIRSIGKAVGGSPTCILCGSSPSILSLQDSLTWARENNLPSGGGGVVALQEGESGGGVVFCPIEHQGAKDFHSSMSTPPPVASAEQIRRAQECGFESTQLPPLLVLDVRSALQRDIVAPSALHSIHIPFHILKDMWLKEGRLGVRRVFEGALRGQPSVNFSGIGGDGAGDFSSGSGYGGGGGGGHAFEEAPDYSGEVLVLCRRGVDSREVAAMLRLSGVPNAVTVEGGLKTWWEKGCAHHGSCAY